MPNITFLPDGVTVTVSEDTTLLASAIQAGLQPDAPCGGNGLCGKCKVIVEGRTLLACETKAEKDMTVVLPPKTGYTILKTGLQVDIRPDGSDAYCLAYDVGTTTVVGYLMDGHTGRILQREGMLNPQTQYGADVISRIQAAMDGSAEGLMTCIRERMNDILTVVSGRQGIAPEQITTIAVVGNSAMHHLLMGIDTKLLVTPPYMPASAEAIELPADVLFPGMAHCRLRVLPLIAGFVGADTVGCMVAARMDRVSELTLMVDIGTNGEMVLSDGKRRVACSAAAGPAFEGAKISRGMRGRPGAIDRVWVEEGQVRFHVIDEAEPVGICGSGLLDLAAVLLKTGIMDESGYLSEGKFVLPGTDISFLQEDVRQLQMTKAAIRAGIRLLCEHMGYVETDIRQVLLAGAFGSFLRPASACRIGMIHPALEERIVQVGNAAGEGSRLCALCENEFLYAKTLAAETEFLELASKPVFQDRFVDALAFEEDIYDDL